MALTKAQIAKLQKDLAKAEADLAKAKTAAAKKPAATPAANDYLRLGPLGGLGAGVVAGVKPSVSTPGVNPISGAPAETAFIYNQSGELEEVYTSGPKAGTSVATGGLVLQGTPGSLTAAEAAGAGEGKGTGAGWVKSATVETEDGPVDVDATGLAADGSRPTPKPVRTMAVDTFKQTLALFFGAEEMTQPWVNALYNVTSKYYKTGSTIDESLNLALQDVRNNPELATFTKRFKGLYDLQDRLAKGEVVEVPTIAGFFKSQVALGDVVTRAGLPDLNNREILGDILGTGKSVSETTALINNVFAAIDNAPQALKEDLQRVAPGADRTAIARALLMGKQGAAALTKQIAATTVFSAARSQGLAVDMGTAADYAARGFDYGTSLTGFGTVARGREPFERLTEISTGKAVTPEQAQTTLQQSVFENSVEAQEKIRLEAEREAARYGGRAGTIGSRSLASRNRANRVI